MKEKTSIIFTLPKNKFQEIVNSSHSLREVLIYFGITANGSTYKMIHERIKIDEIDISNMKKKKQA